MKNWNIGDKHKNIFRFLLSRLIGLQSLLLNVNIIIYKLKILSSRTDIEGGCASFKDRNIFHCFHTHHRAYASISGSLTARRDLASPQLSDLPLRSTSDGPRRSPGQHLVMEWLAAKVMEVQVTLQCVIGHHVQRCFDCDKMTADWMIDCMMFISWQVLEGLTYLNQLKMLEIKKKRKGGVSRANKDYQPGYPRVVGTISDWYHLISTSAALGAMTPPISRAVSVRDSLSIILQAHSSGAKLSNDSFTWQTSKVTQMK